MHRVHTEKLGRNEKRALWDDIIKEFLASDMGLTQYCKEKGIHYENFYYHLRQHKQKQTSHFIPVTLPTPTHNMHTEQQIKVQTGKLTLYVPLCLSPEQLCAILQGVAQGC